MPVTVSRNLALHEHPRALDLETEPDEEHRHIIVYGDDINRTV
jgi:hypothetical protein